MGPGDRDLNDGEGAWGWWGQQEIGTLLMGKKSS